MITAAEFPEACSEGRIGSHEAIRGIGGGGVRGIGPRRVQGDALVGCKARSCQHPRGC